MIPEKADFYLIKRYLEADGENQFGPDIYVIKANCREAAVRLVTAAFPDEMPDLRIFPIQLPVETPMYIGTLVRKEPENLDWAIDR